MVRNPKQLFAAKLWLLADLERANSQRRSFASRAYRSAVWALDDLPASLTSERSELLAVPGIGETIADLAIEFLQTGQIRRLDRLALALPTEASSLARLPRMTPKRLRELKSELGIETAADLMQMIEEGRIESLSGIGEGTAQLWRGRLVEATRPGLPIPRAVGLAERFRAHFQRHFPGHTVEIVGSVRRLDEWIETIELTIDSLDGLADFVAQSALVSAFGTERGAIVVETLGGSLVLTSVESSKPQDALEFGSTLRDSHVRGDFHLHSNWSPDGRQTLDSIVLNSRELGWEYIAITDHAHGLRFGGLDVAALHRQHEELLQVRESNPDLLVLHGSELNVDREGGLDFDDETLAVLDFRLAAVHSHFGLPRAEQTTRVLTTISNPLVHAIGHLTGRRIGMRPPIALDLEAVFETAALYGTALEVNGHLDRLDLSADNCRMAAARGAYFLTSSDAHGPAELRNVFNGVRLLQNAGVDRERVINTWDRDSLLAWLHNKKAQRTSTPSSTTSSRS